MPLFKKLVCIVLLLSTPLWGNWVSPTPEKLCPGETVRFEMGCGAEEYAAFQVYEASCGAGTSLFNFNRDSGVYDAPACDRYTTGNTRDKIEVATTRTSGVNYTRPYAVQGACPYRQCSASSHCTPKPISLDCQCTSTFHYRQAGKPIDCDSFSLGYIDRVASSNISLQFSVSSDDARIQDIRCCTGSSVSPAGCSGSDISRNFTDQVIASARPGAVTAMQLNCTQNELTLSWVAPGTGDITAFNLTVPGRTTVWIPAWRRDIELPFPDQSGEISLQPFYRSGNNAFCQGSGDSVAVDPAVVSVTGVHFRQTQCDRGEVSWNTVDDELPVVYRVALYRGKQNITLTDEASASPFSFTLSDYVDGTSNQTRVSVTSVATCGAYQQASDTVVSDSFSVTSYVTAPVLVTRGCGVSDAGQGNLSVHFLLEPGGQRIPQVINVTSPTSFELEPLEDGRYRMVLSLPGNTSEFTFSSQPVFMVAPGEQCTGQPTLYTEEINTPQITVNYTVLQDSQGNQNPLLSFEVEGVNGSCAYCLAVFNETQDSRLTVCGTEVSDEFPCSMPWDIAVDPADTDNLQALKVYSNSTDGECWQVGVDLEPTIIPVERPVTTTDTPASTGGRSTYLLPTATLTRTTLFPQQTKGAENPESGEDDSWVWGVVAVESVALVVVVSTSLFVVYKIYRLRHGRASGAGAGP